METECKTLEFKLEKTTTYLKTVSAFANYFDGEIRFGVSDDGHIKPIANQTAFILDIENQINDCIKPQPNYYFVANTNGTVSLFVKKGLNTPYLYKNKAYKRNDTSTIEVDDIEIKRLILEGQNLDFDEVKYIGGEKLTFNVLSYELSKSIYLSKFDDDTLRNLELLTPNGYNNAAALLADKNNFSGLEIAILSDNNTFKERLDLSHVSLIEQFNVAMKVFERNYVLEKVDGERRSIIELIPKVAFREMIANAIIHRTYDIKANTKVLMYEDRIEITSPGGLMFGISEEQFLRGAFSLLRNQIVANVFKRLRIIEAFATGVPRTLEVYADSERKPSFEFCDQSIKVVLPTKEASLLKSTEHKQFLDLLNPNIKYSRQEIENLSGFNKDKTIRILNELVEIGLVEKEGNGKATLYHKK